MRLLTVALVANLVTYVYAYAAAGAYERMLYYYAYLMDTELNNGIAKTWATGCSKSSTPCTFKAFIAFISEGKDVITFDPVFANGGKYPLLDETADLLTKNFITVAYNPSRIYGKAPRLGGIHVIFQQLSTFVKGPVAPKIGSIPRDLQVKLSNSVKSVARLRVAAAVGDLNIRLGALPYISEIPFTATPLYSVDGITSSETVDVIDGNSLFKANRNNPGYDRAGLANMLRDWSSDEGHQNNMKSTRDASSVMDLVFDAC